MNLLFGKKERENWKREIIMEKMCTKRFEEWKTSSLYYSLALNPCSRVLCVGCIFSRQSLLSSESTRPRPRRKWTKNGQWSLVRSSAHIPQHSINFIENEISEFNEFKWNRTDEVTHTTRGWLVFVSITRLQNCPFRHSQRSFTSKINN